MAQINRDIDEWVNRKFDLQVELIALNAQHDEIINSLNIANAQVKAQEERFNSYKEAHAENLRLHKEQCEKAEQDAAARLVVI